MGFSSLVVLSPLELAVDKGWDFFFTYVFNYFIGDILLGVYLGFSI